MITDILTPKQKQTLAELREIYDHTNEAFDEFNALFVEIEATERRLEHYSQRLEGIADLIELESYAPARARLDQLVSELDMASHWDFTIQLEATGLEAELEMVRFLDAPENHLG